MKYKEIALDLKPVRAVVKEYLKAKREVHRYNHYTGQSDMPTLIKALRQPPVRYRVVWCHGAGVWSMLARPMSLIECRDWIANYYATRHLRFPGAIIATEDAE